MGIRAAATILSFGSTVFWLGFFWFAPFFGFPLDWTVDEPQRFIEIITPVFLGFLISAALYAVNPADVRLPTGEKYLLIKIILYGGIAAFYLIMVLLCVAFALGHSADGSRTYLSLSQFSSGVATAVSILTGVVAIVLGYVFNSPAAKPENPSGDGGHD
jgi:hypothetical protein